MKYVRILADAWGLTTANKKLTWFIFVPSVAVILLFIAEVAYQYVSFGEEFGWIEHGRMYGFIGNSIQAIHGSGLMWLLILFVILGALLLFVLKPWIDATLILSIRHRFAFPEQRFSLRKQVSNAHEYFLSLLEYNLLIAPFAPISILLYAASFYRYMHGGETYFVVFLPILITLSVFSLFVHFFLVFMPFYLVNDGCEVFKSLTNSMGLVFRHFGKTLSLFMVMLLVSLRIIVNVIVVVGVPLGSIALGTYFATSSYYTVFLFFIGFISLVLVIGASYLTAILEVFSTSFWYRAFQVFKEIDQEGEEQETADTLPVHDPLEGPVEPAPQSVKIVHIVHHVQPGETLSDEELLTDVHGEIRETKDVPSLASLDDSEHHS